MAKNYLLRVISSSDHDLSKDQLIDLIQKTGSDRYDKTRKQMFDGFYSQYNVDFFAVSADESNLDIELARLLNDFPKKTLGDRKQAIAPDIAIIYDADKCEMINNVYEELETSDCYRFIGKPERALVDVREVK